MINMANKYYYFYILFDIEYINKNNNMYLIKNFLNYQIKHKNQNKWKFFEIDNKK